MTKYKLPSKIQVEPIECGAVATWIILGYYKKWLTTEESRLEVEPREALDQVSKAVQLIKNNIASSTLDVNTLDIFCAQLLDIAEQMFISDGLA